MVVISLFTLFAIPLLLKVSLWGKGYFIHFSAPADRGIKLLHIKKTVHKGVPPMNSLNNYLRFTINSQDSA